MPNRQQLAWVCPQAASHAIAEIMKLLQAGHIVPGSIFFYMYKAINQRLPWLPQNVRGLDSRVPAADCACA